MQISIKDYRKTLPNLEKELDEQAMCALKWIHQYVHLGHGAVKACHNVPHRYITIEEVITYGKDIFCNHPYEIERRTDKLNNIKHAECQSCWSSEEKKVRSCRLPKPFYELHRSRFGNGESELTAMPTQLEIAFSNVCDLKCIYCSGHSSSQWEAEDQKFNIAIQRQTEAPAGFVDAFWQWLEEDAIEHILQFYILGGEPLIQSEFYTFLDRLIPLVKNNPNRFNIKPELIIVTNAHAPTKYLDKWISKAKEVSEVMSVQINISIEGYGPRAEYIRSNLIWERFAQNVDRIFAFAKEYNADIRFSITHSAMSITSCLELLRWIKSLKDKHGIDVDLIRTSVASPSYLAPWILSADFSCYIDEVCTWITDYAPEWELYIGHLNAIKASFGNHTTEDLQRFGVWEKEIFRKRNMSAIKIFPEMKEWIEGCQR